MSAPGPDDRFIETNWRAVAGWVAFSIAWVLLIGLAIWVGQR